MTINKEHLWKLNTSLRKDCLKSLDRRRIFIDFSHLATWELTLFFSCFPQYFLRFQFWHKKHFSMPHNFFSLFLSFFRFSTVNLWWWIFMFHGSRYHRTRKNANVIIRCFCLFELKFELTYNAKYIRRRNINSRPPKCGIKYVERQRMWVTRYAFQWHQVKSFCKHVSWRAVCSAASCLPATNQTFPF